MKCNVGGADRVIRILLGLVLLLVGWYMLDRNWIAMAIGAVVLITGVWGRCLLYYPLGINTCKSRSSE